MYATMAIAIPTGVKVFNWVATMWRGSLTFETPMLFALGFVMMFTIGGFSGLMLALVPADFQYQDTFFVVAHFHYVLYPGAIFGTMAAVYYWLPKWTGHRYDERLGKIHFWAATIGVNLTFFPMHFSGLAGMPRRVVDYSLQFADFNRLSTIGAAILGLTQLLFLYIVIKTIRGSLVYGSTTKPAATRRSAASSSSIGSGSRVISSAITSSLTQSVSRASRASWAVSTASALV